MISEDQKQAILNYGEAKYSLGYRDGYVSGIITGVLLSSICLVMSELVKKQT